MQTHPHRGRLCDLRGRDFSKQTLVGADFSDADLSHAWFAESDLTGADFSRALLREANFRGANLTNADISGADLYGAVMEDAVLTGIKSDEYTRFFRLHCPETGAFIGYKRCFDHRLVTLYIPADARRSSATLPSCRADKAFVVSITDFEHMRRFDEAISLVDDDFVYRRGEMVYANNYNPDRWRDSTGGIHFWMTKEEAFRY